MPETQESGFAHYETGGHSGAVNHHSFSFPELFRLANHFGQIKIQSATALGFEFAKA